MPSYLAGYEVLYAENPRAAAFRWFREAKFGLFIHWGVYAVPAGEWAGTKYGGGVEWIQAKAKIPDNFLFLLFIFCHL